MEKYRSSTGKTLLIAAIYCLLFLAGDLCGSVVFDLLFSNISLPNSAWYQMFRMSGCLLITVLFFWLYTEKCLHLKRTDFRIAFSIQK